MTKWDRVHDVEVPDLWPEIESRVDHVTPVRPPTGWRIGVTAAVALSVALIAWSLFNLGGSVSHPVGPSGALNARIPVDEPQPIVAGEGAVWVVGGTTATGNSLWRIDPATNRSRELPGTAASLWPAVGEGSAWVAASDHLLKIDPISGDVTDSIPLPGEPFAAYAGLGSVWVSTTEGLVQVDPTSDEARTLPINTDLLAATDDWLWATGAGSHGVAKIDPASGSVVDTVPFHDPCILAAAENAVWVASCEGDMLPDSQPDRLVRIDASTADVMYSVALDSWGHLAFADRWLWIAHWTDQRVTVDQIDPDDGHATGVRAVVRPGDSPWMEVGIGTPAVFTAIADGSFWLTHVDADDVVRVEIPIPQDGAG